MYKENFKKSWLELKKNIVLLLPDLINVLFIMALGYVILSITGLYDFFKDMPLLLNSENYYDTLFFIQNNLSTMILGAIIFVVVAFFVSIGISAVKFGMIRDVVNKKSASIKSGLGYVNKYYWRIFGVKIWTFLIYLGVIIATLILYFVLSALQLGITAVIVSIIFLIVLVILVVLKLLFRYAALFIKNSDSKKAIGLSYKFFKENKGYSLIVLCWVILVALVVSIIFDILGLIPGIGDIIQSLESLATIIISVWANIFLFNSYLKR